MKRRSQQDPQTLKAVFLIYVLEGEIKSEALSHRAYRKIGKQRTKGYQVSFRPEAKL